MTSKIICEPFAALHPTQLYDLLRLRSEVFVVEQQCIFLDMDNKDQNCHHLLLYRQDHLAGCARLLPAGLYYTDRSIGRIVTSPETRGTGLGQELVSEAIAACYRLFGAGPIRIGAQLYAKGFYEKFGFVQAGEVYDEDGIDHIHMMKATDWVLAKAAGKANNPILS